MPSIFISYRRDDSKAFTNRFFLNLSDKLSDFDVFYDKDGIEYGEVIPDRLNNELEKANLVFVIIGLKWLTILNDRILMPEKDWVREEVKRSLEDDSKTVVPLLIHNADKPKEELLPADISSLYNLNEICFVEGEEWKKNMEDIVHFAREWYYNRPDEFLIDGLRDWYSYDILFNEIPIPNLTSGDRQKITMENYFISPSYISLKDQEKRDSWYKKEATSSASVIKQRKRSFHNFIPHDIISNKLLSTNTNALVIGNPGTGKSTFARWLCYDWAKGAKDVDVLPCYVMLRNIDFSTDGFLYKSLRTAFKFTSIESLKYVLSNSKKPKIWILDGYDELNTTNQLVLFKAVQQLENNHSYLLFTRPYGMLYDPGFAFSQRIQLDGFNPSQINAYISEYLSLFNQLPKKQTLLDILDGNQVLSDYAHNPMMLSFIVGVFLKEDKPEVNLAKIDSNFKLQSRVYYWIKDREIQKAIVEKSEEGLTLTDTHYELAYDMELSMEFIKYGYSYEKWFKVALALNNMGLARMSQAESKEVVFSFNSITFQEFLSVLYLPPELHLDVLDYLSRFPIFWNLLKMVIGRQSQKDQQQFVDSVLHKMKHQFEQKNELKYLYLLFMFLAECPAKRINAFSDHFLIEQFYSFFKINGESSDKWRVLLLEAIQKVYYKLDFPNQKHLRQLLLDDISPGLKLPPEDKENDAYTIPNGTKVLVQQLSLYNDSSFMISLIEHLKQWILIAEEGQIYAYEVIVFMLEELALKTKPAILRKDKENLIQIFKNLPSLYTTSSVRVLNRIGFEASVLKKDDFDLPTLLSLISNASLTEEEVFSASNDLFNYTTTFYLDISRQNSANIDKASVLPFFSAVSSFMANNEVDDYDREEIFQLCSEAVQGINDFEVYDSIFRLAGAAEASYSGVIFTDTNKLFEWFTLRLTEAVKYEKTEELLFITYALILCDSIQVRFHRIRALYLKLCQMFIDEHRSFFASFEGKHSDVYFQYSSEANEYLMPFEKLIYFGREDNLWGEADKLALLQLALHSSNRELAFFRDSFIPGIMGTEFNLYKDTHWAIVYDYMEKLNFNALFAILRNRQLYSFESNLIHLEKIADFIQSNLMHTHFHERSYLIVEFCSRTLTLIYHVRHSSNYDFNPLIATVESLLLHPSVLNDFRKGEVMNSIEGIDSLGYVIAYVLTLNEALNCINDYELLFTNFKFEQAGFLNGIIKVFSNVDGMELDVVESLYPILGKAFEGHLVFLIEHAGYWEKFDRGRFEGMVG